MNTDTTAVNTTVDKDHEVRAEETLEATDLGSAASETKGGPIGGFLDGAGWQLIPYC